MNVLFIIEVWGLNMIDYDYFYFGSNLMSFF